LCFCGFLPLIDRLVKIGTGNEREKRWGVDRINDIGTNSNLCPPWASSPNVVGATACATVPPQAGGLLTVLMRVGVCVCAHRVAVEALRILLARAQLEEVLKPLDQDGAWDKMTRP